MLCYCECCLFTMVLDVFDVCLRQKYFKNGNSECSEPLKDLNAQGSGTMCITANFSCFSLYISELFRNFADNLNNLLNYDVY